MIGWILIIIWGMVLFVGGRVVGIIIDDLLRRCRCNYWTESFHGVIIWGLIAGLWMTVVGFGSYFWFNFSYNPTQFEDWKFMDGSSYLSLGDAMWFSYISLLTVGMLLLSWFVLSFGVPIFSFVPVLLYTSSSLASRCMKVEHDVIACTDLCETSFLPQ
mmetsp:Transcript_12959/g.12772  ORF Transcript_12959/g.12772 Transcript_12959/m.12772 type:complete len:159 (-) Transcript_12959:31-507(-)